MNPKALTQASNEVVILGGGLAGVMAALAARERGLPVTLVEKRAYLGREISAKNQTFLGTPATDDVLRRLPAPMHSLFACRPKPDEIMVPEGSCRMNLVSRLLEAGVKQLFESEPVGLAKRGPSACGVIFSGPTGLFYLPASSVVDATESLCFARRLSGQDAIPAGRVAIHTAFEMTDPALGKGGFAVAGSELRAAEHAVGLVPQSVSLHPTLRNDTVNITLSALVDAGSALLSRRSRLETATRRLAFKTAAWLRQNVPALGNADLTHLAYEAAWTDARPRPTPVCENIRLAPLLPWGFQLDDLARAWDALSADDFFQTPPTPSSEAAVVMGMGPALPLGEFSPTPLADDGLPADVWALTLPKTWEAANTLETDVCVAGVGAAGGLAMGAVSEAGLRVASLEINHGLGGTFTLGKVNGYYHGWQEGINPAYAREATASWAAVAKGNGSGGLPHAMHLMEKAEASGVTLFTGTQVCGVRMEGRRLTHVVASNECGAFTVACRVAIDTTGNADLAAFAGAGFEVGDPKDGMVQTYSMWGTDILPAASWLSSRYLRDPDIIHPDRLGERLRAVILAHRGNSPFHISPMLTPREGRRIRGRASLSVGDIVLGRTPKDTVAVAFTPADSHAYTSSDLARTGWIGSGVSMKVRIPYGAFLPESVDGLLVAAKAFSGERDATSFARMNADVKNAGYSVGLAAALAVKGNKLPHEISVPALQQELFSKALLPSWAMEMGPATDFQALAKRLTEEGLAALEQALHQEDSAFAPILANAWTGLASGNTSHPDGRLALALALAWHGRSEARAFLNATLKESLDEKRHLSEPQRTCPRMHERLSLTGRDDFSGVNRLVLCVSRVADGETRALMARLIRETPGFGEPVAFPMPYDERRGDIIRDPFHNRLLLIALVAERLAEPSLAPAMEALLAREGVTGHDVPLHSWQTPRYLRAHVELSLARAAHRCGSSAGKRILERFTRDAHSFFREHARKELERSAAAA